MSRTIFRRKVAGKRIGSGKVLNRVICASVCMSIMALGACSDNSETRAGKSAQVTATGKAAIGGSYTLVHHGGKTVTDADFHGRPQLIYFGYAYCPDVCPTALQQMGAALSMAGDAADLYQPIFITIDAKRDTPEMMAQYVTANGFPKNLIGLTGSQAQLDHAMKAFKVYGQRIEDPDSATSYTYDHSSIIYLMDKNGEFVDVFTHDSTPKQIAERLVTYSKTGK